MKRVEIVQLGLGYVGRAVAQSVIEERKRWREQPNLVLHYRAVSDIPGALVGEEPLPQAIRLKENGGKLAELGVEPTEAVLASWRCAKSRASMEITPPYDWGRPAVLKTRALAPDHDDLEAGKHLQELRVVGHTRGAG